VPLGKVIEIVTSSAAYESRLPPEKRRNYIVVRAEVRVSEQQQVQVEQIKRESPELVKLGLRVQTQLAGITGGLYLSLDLLNPEEYSATALPFEWTPKYQYVPSAPSLTGQIIANAQAFLASLNKAQIQELTHNLNTLILDVDKKLEEMPLAELSAKAENVLADTDATIRRIDPGLKRSVDNVAAFTDDLRKLAEQGELDSIVKNIDDLALRLDALIGDNQYDVRVIVQDLRVTAANLRTLSETVKRYPAGALVGGPPAKVEVPGSSK
jgi:phospholipid/cholesterol/gamma-HCH transport system substrate-binding protein/paraquat-inducible protein B